MHKIAEKTTEIRKFWDPTEDHQTWDRLDIETLIDTYLSQYPDAEISARIDGDAIIHVRNVDLFEQALSEAVENAIKHVERSPPDVTITVQRDSDADQIRISVSDNGPGIPELEQHVIESGEETPLNHSLGVGFWLMEWVTTTLGGELTIADNEPQGSVVTFQLPDPQNDQDSTNRDRE